ncbi:MAG: hypothetical protein HY860_01245 [Chlamydiales bacterium]|nr:hypothetical protein [Chlamydiales bacterium]
MVPAQGQGAIVGSPSFCDSFYDQNKTLTRQYIDEPNLNPTQPLRLQPLKAALLFTVTTPIELAEVITRLAIGILACPLVFVNPNQFLKEFVYIPLTGLGDVVGKPLFLILSPVIVFTNFLSTQNGSIFYRTNRSLTSKYVVDPVSKLVPHFALSLQCFVSIITVPLEAVETIGRLALAILAFPVVFIDKDLYLKEFIYTPALGLVKVVFRVVVAPIELIARLFLDYVFYQQSRAQVAQRAVQVAQQVAQHAQP